MKKDKNIKIISKAWKCSIDYFFDIDDYSRHCVESESYYGDNAMKIKKHIIERNDDIEERNTGKQLSFDVIRLERQYSDDKVSIMCGNKEITCKREDVYDYIKTNEVFNNLVDDELYIIQDKRSYHGNAICMWADKGNGYTYYLDKAWKLTGSELRERGVDAFRLSDMPIKLSDIRPEGFKTIIDCQYLKKAK